MDEEMTRNVISVRDLHVSLSLAGNTVTPVDGISFDVRAERVLGHRRRVRIGQEPVAARRARPAAAGRGIDRIRALRVRGRQDRSGCRARARTRGGDGLPGADDRPEPDDARRRPHRGGSAGHRRTFPTSDQGAGDRAHGERRHPRTCAPCSHVAARAVGRAPPARDDRRGPRHRARDPVLRRTDDRPRRHDPGPDPRTAARPARGARHGDGLRLARSGRRIRGMRSHRGDVRRKGRRDRTGRRGAALTPPPLHGGPAGIGTLFHAAERTNWRRSPGPHRTRATSRADAGLLRAAHSRRRSASGRRTPSTETAKGRPPASAPKCSRRWRHERPAGGT